MRLIMEEVKTILKELLQNADQLRDGQAKFVRSVNRNYKKYKRISDKQSLVLMDMYQQLNEKIHFDNMMLKG
jgi:hypothetical protein